MKSFLAFTLLVVSCSAQFPTRTTIYGDNNNNNNINMMDLLKYQGPYSSQFYGQQPITTMRGQNLFTPTPTTTNNMDMEKLIQMNRFLRALQFSNPELVQQQLPTRRFLPYQQQPQIQETTGLMSLSQLLRTELFKQYLLGQLTNEDLVMNRLPLRPTYTTTTPTTNDMINLRRLLWTHPQLMATLLNNPVITQQLREQLNNNFIQNTRTMPMYGDDQMTTTFPNTQTGNRMMMPIYGEDQTTRGIMFTPQQQEEMVMMNRIEPTTRNTFNGIPTTMNQRPMDMPLIMMMTMDKQNQIPTTTNTYGRFVPKIMRTTVIMTKPMMKEIITDKKVQEKTVDPVLGQEQITTGDVKIIDKKIIPTTPEMVAPEPIVMDDPMTTNEDMTMTLENTKAKVTRDAMIKKSISLIKKMMNANKRFTKFNTEQEQIIPLKDQLDITTYERPTEMMTGAEETVINKMNNLPRVPLDIDTIRSRRQSRLNLERQFILNGGENMPTTPFEYQNTQPMMNKQIYTFNNIEGQQEQLMDNNSPIRYTTLNKRDTPTMTYTTTGENGLHSVPLTPGNTYIGTGFSVTNPGDRYTLPNNNMNMMNTANEAYIGV